jgi:hypothetical protein
MLNTKHNYHHSKLPAIGSISRLISSRTWSGDERYLRNSKDKYIVIAYPLCDNCLPYSKGIHTVWAKNLRTNDIIRVSGFYFPDHI